MITLNDEVTKTEQIYNELKDLAKSPVPVVQDSALLMLGLAVDLLKQIDPARFMLDEIG